MCAHASSIVGSALADPYLSFSAGLNGMTGCFYGEYQMRALNWLLKIQVNFLFDGGFLILSWSDGVSTIDVTLLTIASPFIIPPSGSYHILNNFPPLNFSFYFSFEFFFASLSKFPI